MQQRLGSGSAHSWRRRDNPLPNPSAAPSRDEYPPFPGRIVGEKYGLDIIQGIVGRRDGGSGGDPLPQGGGCCNLEGLVWEAKARATAASYQQFAREDLGQSELRRMLTVEIARAAAVATLHTELTALCGRYDVSEPRQVSQHVHLRTTPSSTSGSD